MEQVSNSSNQIENKNKETSTVQVALSFCRNTAPVLAVLGFIMAVFFQVDIKEIFLGSKEEKQGIIEKRKPNTEIGTIHIEEQHNYHLGDDTIPQNDSEDDKVSPIIQKITEVNVGPGGKVGQIGDIHNHNSNKKQP